MPQLVDDHGVALTYYEWLVPEPRGVVHLAHGIGEHALRYQYVAERLNRAGYAVYADDHRGHGQTGLDQAGGDPAKLGRQGPGGMRATERGIAAVGRAARAAHPGLPVAFVGHSWGSLLGQRLLNADATAYDAWVLTGTAYRMPGSMNGGDLAARHHVDGGSGFEWLSRDEAVGVAFAEDPLTFAKHTVRVLGIADGLRLFGRPARGLPAATPLLILEGEDDSLGGGTSAERLAEAYRTRSGLTDVTLRVYPDARHEVFAELNKDEVIGDLIDWLGTRLPVSSTDAVA